MLYTYRGSPLFNEEWHHQAKVYILELASPFGLVYECMQEFRNSMERAHKTNTLPKTLEGYILFASEALLEWDI